MEKIKIIVIMAIMFLLSVVPAMASTLVSEEFFGISGLLSGENPTNTLGSTEYSPAQIGVYTYGTIPLYWQRGAFLLNFSNYTTCTFDEAQIYFTRENGYQSPTARFYYSLNQTLQPSTTFNTQPCGNTVGTIEGNCNQTALFEVIGGSHSNGDTFQPDTTNANFSAVINKAIQVNNGLISFEIVAIDTEGVSEKALNLYGSRATSGRPYLNVSYQCVLPDTTPPTITSTTINNTSPDFNYNVGISAECSDDTSVGNIYYANNMTGVLTNVSSSGAVANPYNYSVVAVNTINGGQVVGSVFTCVDGAGNSVQSNEIMFTSSAYPPMFSSTLINNTNPAFNEDVGISGVCSDDVGLSNIYYENNMTGTSLNVSNSGAVGTPYNYSVMVVNTAPVFAIIGNKFTCVDNTGSSVQSNVLTFESKDSINPVQNWVSPTPPDGGNINVVSVTFNMTIVETNLDKIVFNFNGTNETNTFSNDFGNVWSLNKVLTALGTYIYYVFVNDTSGNSFTSTTRSFVLDNVTPVVVFNYPLLSNTSSTFRTGNLNIQGQNILLNIGNLTVYNGIGDVIYNNVVSNINLPTYTFSDSIATIFGSQPDGTYMIDVCFEDYVFLKRCRQATLQINSPPPPPPNLGIRDTLSETGNGIGVMINAIRLPIGQFTLFLAIVGAVVALITGLVFAIKKITSKHL